MLFTTYWGPQQHIYRKNPQVIPSEELCFGGGVSILPRSALAAALTAADPLLAPDALSAALTGREVGESPRAGMRVGNRRGKKLLLLHDPALKCLQATSARSCNTTRYNR